MRSKLSPSEILAARWRLRSARDLIEDIRRMMFDVGDTKTAARLAAIAARILNERSRIEHHE